MILSAIQDFLLDLMTSFIETFGKYIEGIFELMYTMNKELNIAKLCDYTTGLGISLIIFYSIKKANDVYIMQTEGDSEADAFEIVTRMFQAIAASCCGATVIQLTIKLAGIIEKEVNVIDIGKSSDSLSTLESVCSAVGLMTGSAVFITLLMLVSMLIMLVVFCFRAAKRGAELSLFQIVLPLLAMDLVTTSREKWKILVNEIVVCVFGYLIQLLELKIFFNFLAQYGVQLKIGDLLGAMGWMIVILAAPKWMEKILYTSGVGQMAKGSTQSVMMLRYLKR